MSWNKGQSKTATFLHAHVGYQGDDCLSWPYARDPKQGYGNLQYEGRPRWAHRVMCELVNGDPPTPQHEAAHSCGNGHLGCVNPKHLSWKTRSENQRDRIRMGRGRTGKLHKLTPEAVAEIRALEGKTTNAALAERFGVSRGAIRMVLLRQTWPNGEQEKPGFKPGDPRNPFRSRPRVMGRIVSVERSGQ